ncbi:MAG: glycosyl hydrolase family 28-related protein, partial [Fusobacteriaceae bacterium]
KIIKPFVALVSNENKFTIPTIDDLVGRQYLAIGDVVDLQGYYEAGDRAHHKRKIEATDDGSGVQLVGGLWANIVHNGEVNVSWFGAKGDGITDDTNTIQKTINFVNTLIIPYYGDNAGGGRVCFDSKVYVVSNQIRFSQNNVDLIGNNATFLTNFSSEGILFVVGAAEKWQISGKISGANKYNNLVNFKIKRKTGTVGTIGILFSGTRNSTVENVLIEEQNFGIYSENSSEFNFKDVSCIGCGVSFVFDNRFNRTAEKSPLGVSSIENDCSSGVVINPTSYYSQYNCIIGNSCGSIKIIGATFGVFAEKSADGETPLKYELGTFTGASVVISPHVNNSGLVRGFQLDNCVFEAKPQRAGVCVLLSNKSAKGSIGGVIVSGCALQTFKAMSADSLDYTTFIKSDVDGGNVSAVVRDCNIIDLTQGYFYPCFYEQKGKAIQISFENCTPHASFARGLKTSLHDGMIIKDTVLPQDMTNGTLSVVNGETDSRVIINSVEERSYKAINWQSGYIGLKLDYEGNSEDLVFYVVVNGAPDTNSSVQNGTNVSRYSNSNLPFESGTGKKIASIIFIPFSANYGFNSIKVFFGNKSDNNMKFYNLEVGCYKTPMGSLKYNPFVLQETLEIPQTD